jgi:hypothetical protein
MEGHTKMVDKFKNLKTDQIGDGIYIAFEWSDKTLIRIYFGSKTNGPMLQYYADSGWTNLYSRGNFGRKYACGGNWSSQTKNLKGYKGKDKDVELMLDDAGNNIPLPDGIKGDITMTDIDCSGSWTIWYPTAKEAVKARLTLSEINGAPLPAQSKLHLAANETNKVLSALIDVIEAYEL